MLLKRICALAVGAVIVNGAIVGGSLVLKETKNEPLRGETIKPKWSDGLNTTKNGENDLENIDSDYNSFGL